MTAKILPLLRILCQRTIVGLALLGVGGQGLAAPAALPAGSSAADAPAAVADTAGQPLTLLDISELQLDGASALVLTFSAPLDPDQDLAAAVHVSDSVSGKPDGAWELSDDRSELRLRHLLPNRKLAIAVDPGIRAASGATLAQGHQETLVTRDIRPSVGFASKGSLLPTRLAEGLPVLALNVDKADVNFYRIKPGSLPSFLSDWQGSGTLSVWDADDFLDRADLVYGGRFDLNPRPNTRERILLPLDAIEPLKQPGVYLAVMQRAGRYDSANPATLFTLSDIGVSLHSYRDRMDVFAQGLEQGKALKGIEIRVLDDKGRQLQTAATDETGHAQLDKPAGARLLLATRDDQTSMLDLAEPALDLAEFDIGGPEGYGKTLFAFGPRDLYRPGETLLVNALLRDEDGKALAPQPVNVDVVKPDGQVARTFLWQPQNGLYQYQFPIPGSAPTGDWSLRFNPGDKQQRYYHFKVEDFLPERMALEIRAGEQPLAMDSPLSFSVTGRYLYGAPAADNQLQGQVFLRPLREAVPALPGFEFGAINEENLSRRLDELDTTLDGQGQTVITLENSWSDARSPLKAVLQASLLESGGRPVTRRAEQAIWPAGRLAGIRPLFSKRDVYDYRKDSYSAQAMVDNDSQAGFEIVYADAAGHKLAASGLTVRLVRERRDYYWQWSQGDGWQSLFDQKDLAMAAQTVDIPADGTAKVAFDVQWGAYRLEVADPATGLVSSLRFWAGYSWQDNTDGGGAVRPDQVKLQLDKPAYRQGEKARVHVQAPAAGTGYLLVESSDGPLWWQEISLPAEGADFDVPINNDWRRHDLYLSALVIRPGDKQRQMTPKRAVGLLHLPLVEENRQLALRLDAPARMRPNQTLAVKVKATGGGEQPRTINLLLSAVDSGILNITDFKTPDPYDAFLGRKRYSADQYDVYGQLIEAQGRLAGLRYGGDGDGDDPLARGGKKPIAEVNIVAQQAQPVTLDANGEGEVRLAIPDFNGELKLMAQAWSDEDFGSAERNVVVAAPIVAELATPRFLAAGDTSVLALDLTNLSGQPQTLAVTLGADGLVALGAGAAASSQVTLQNGQRTTITIPVKALDGFGQGAVALGVSGMSLPDEVLSDYHHRWTIGVRPPYPAQTRHFASVLHPGDSWSLPPDALSHLTPATAEGQLLLTSRPPLNLARYIRELMAYPYGCLEQTASGLFPSLYASQSQLLALGIKGDSDDQRRRAVDVGIDRLVGMQRDNGGFGLWSNDGEEEFWLSAYAADFLVRAREQGYSVPAAALNKANARLQRYLQDATQIDVHYGSQPAHTRFAVQAYAALVLARQQLAPLGALRQVYERREQSLSGLPLVQLGIALQLMGDMPRAQAAIDLGLQTRRNDRDYGLEDYGSPIRDSALILALLNEYHLRPEQRDRLMLALSDALNGQRWFSTQESNALFMAGRDQLGAGDKQPPWRATFNAKQDPVSRDDSLNRRYDAGQLAAGLQIANTGGVPLYARFDLVGYPQSAPPAGGENLGISRVYRDPRGNPLSLSDLTSGQLVVVQLTITARQHVPDALVVELLPAGLELENQNLGESSAGLDDSAEQMQPLLNAMRQADIKHQEFRGDRYVAAVDVDAGNPVTLLYLARAVTPGSYRVPPSQVESMYVPAWRAVGATEDTLNVR